MHSPRWIDFSASRALPLRARLACSARDSARTAVHRVAGRVHFTAVRRVAVAVCKPRVACGDSARAVVAGAFKPDAEPNCTAGIVADLIRPMR